MGNNYLMGTEFQLGKMKSILGLDGVMVTHNVDGLSDTELYT
jgi:hypothetical protein